MKYIRRFNESTVNTKELFNNIIIETEDDIKFILTNIEMGYILSEGGIKEVDNGEFTFCITQDFSNNNEFIENNRCFNDAKSEFKSGDNSKSKITSLIFKERKCTLNMYNLVRSINESLFIRIGKKYGFIFTIEGVSWNQDTLISEVSISAKSII